MRWDAPAAFAAAIAMTTTAEKALIVADLDARVAPIAGKVGPITLTRLLDETMLRLHAEEREVKQLEDLDARYVRLDESSINDTGTADLFARGDWKYLHDLDLTLTALAAALKERGCPESLDVRRSMALGILADPEQAHAMLTDREAPAPAANGSCCTSTSARPPWVGVRSPAPLSPPS